MRWRSLDHAWSEPPGPLHWWAPLCGLLLALSACATAPSPPAPRPPPAVEDVQARRSLAAAPSPSDATADRPWCRRACRHLRALAATGGGLDECITICRRWGSGERIRCLLEATTLDEADRCTW